MATRAVGDHSGHNFSRIEAGLREHLYMEGRNPRKYVYFAISLG